MRREDRGGGMSEQAPEGYRYEWVPDPRWTTDKMVIANRFCRWARSECGRPAVAAMDRGRRLQGARRLAWWCYCEAHLYGRRIDGSAVMVRKLVPDPSAVTRR